ncbi:hypothetical protein HDU85_002563 [Gaertneriomyces sp. JEL0708]|nr:hypothetical protein HDU85_002563 [Gaertneriomyces sp. JEL0708]
MPLLFSVFIDVLAAAINIFSAVRSICAAFFSLVERLFGFYGAVSFTAFLIALFVYLVVSVFFPRVSSYTPATSQWNASKKQRNYEHLWVEGDMILLDHGQGPAYCNACSNLVVSGITCLICKRCAHKAHHHLVEDMPCKILYDDKTTDGNSKDSPPPSREVAQPHQWVEGNISLGARCAVCHQAAGSEPTLKDVRCAWCNVAVHTMCCSKYRSKCPLGPFPESIVPPHLVRRVSKQQRGATKKADPRFLVAALSDPSLQPLLCIVNPTSGAQNAPALLRSLLSLVNPVQVVDTSRENPEALIRAFEPVLSRCRVLVCGGDGTVQWIISILDKVIPEGQPRPPVGILPLGTGNDLARVLGWGGGWTDETVIDIVRDVIAADAVDLDRWTVEVETIESSLTGAEKMGRALHLVPKKEPKRFVMNNYFSIGTDASVALEFHEARLLQPQFFRNRLLNKVWYALLGGKHQFINVLSWIGILKPSNISLPEQYGNSITHAPGNQKPFPLLSPSEPAMLSTPGVHEPLSSTELYLDADPHAVDLTDIGAVIILNIPSYAGGGKIYSAAEADGHPPSRFDDEKLEVLAVVSPLHLGASVVGITSPGVLGHARTIRLVVNAPQVAMQVDGEPWRQDGPCTVSITFLGKTKMLKRNESLLTDVADSDSDGSDTSPSSDQEDLEIDDEE